MSNTPSTPPPDPHPPTSEDWITRTRWIMYGAATTLVESLQDLEKGKATWQKVATADWPHLAEELATKGETTEQEARRYVEQMMNQPASTPSNTPNNTPSEPMDPAADSQPSPPSSPPIEPPISGTDPLSSPTPPAPTGSGSGSGASGVSSDEILELMDLTRQIESLRLDLERKRLEHPDS